MNPNIDELINGYLDETLCRADQDRLAAWIKSAPENAEYFARASMLHDRLQSELSHGADLNELADTETKPSNVASFPGPLSPLSKWLPQVAAVIALTLTVLFWINRPTSQGNNEPDRSAAFATLAHSVNAQFIDSQPLAPGHRLGAERIRLESGFISLQFDSGVEVTLQGPAQYELLASNRTRLSEGQLTADVPPGAEGFRVDTPTAQVTDLGTAFGLELDENQASHVSVFSGEVSVAENGSSSTVSLKEGEALKIDATRGPATIEFDPTRFEKHWPVSSGIERSTGAFRLIPPWRRLRFARSDERIFVRREGYTVTLNKPLEVNISEPGRYTKEEQLTPTTLPPSQAVKSLILHYQPIEPRARRDVKRLIGTITFTRPILGLITQHEELKASARRFHHMSAGESHPRRELDLNGRPVGDVVEISMDRRTLHLDLASPMFSSDLLRVIVDAEMPKLEVASTQ